MPYPAKDHDRCDWWRSHKDQLPQLSVVARYILGIPASSATSERFFSSGGLIVSNLRCSLEEYKVEDLLKIRLNLTKLEDQEKGERDAMEKKTLARGGGVIGRISVEDDSDDNDEV